jgi:hypothetical protein
VVVLGIVIYCIWYYSQIFFLLLACGYVFSGPLVRIGGVLRRRFFRRRPRPAPAPGGGAN